MFYYSFSLDFYFLFSLFILSCLVEETLCVNIVVFLTLFDRDNVYSDEILVSINFYMKSLFSVFCLVLIVLQYKSNLILPKT